MSQSHTERTKKTEETEEDNFANNRNRLSVFRPSLYAEIHNVVASVDLQSRFKLDKVLTTLPPKFPSIDVSYIPENFPGVILKFRNPKVTILLFSSGKIVVTGARNTKIIDDAIETIVKVMREIGYSMKKKPIITIQNIVAASNLTKKVNLELAALLMEHSLYEPEQFPGLIFRMPDPKLVLLVFQSGKLVITGGRNPDHILIAVNRLYDILDEIQAFHQDF